MASRAFKKMLNSLVENLTYIQGTFQTDGSGNVKNPPIGSITGNGVKSVTHAGTGVYQIRLMDAYNRYFLGNAGVVSGIASPTSDGSFTPGDAYMIAVVGTLTGLLTIAHNPTLADVNVAVVGGFSSSVTSSASATLDVVALANVLNGNFITITPPVASVSAGTYQTLCPVTIVGSTGNSGTFDVDEKVTGSTSGAVGYATNASTGGSALLLVQVTGTFVAGETVTGGKSSATLTGTTFTPATKAVVVSPAVVNYIPVDGPANLVGAAPGIGSATANAYAGTVTLTSNNPNPNPAITLTVSGSDISKNFATIPATDWYAAGLDAGLVPLVGASFIAALAGGAGDGTASLPATATPAYCFNFSVLGNTETIINSPEGGCVYTVVRRTDTGALVDPLNAVVGFDMFLRNSSIKGQGE